jgi:cytoskeleton protein RodZ
VPLTPPAADAYDPSGMPAAAGEHSASSFGEALRRERELRRIALRDVSEATKINIRYLEALERNEFTYLPAGAFTRGFIRSYARFIGTDESEMINAYLYELTQQEKQKKGQPKDGQHASLLHLRCPGSKPERRGRRWAILLAGLVLLLALAIALPLYLHHRSAERNPPAAAAPRS